VTEAPLALVLRRFQRDLVPEIPGRFVIPPPLRAFTAAGIAAKTQRPLLAVVAGEREAEDLADDVALFTDLVRFLPAWETLPFEHVSPNVQTMARRAEARHLLQTGAPVIVVGSVRAVGQRLSPTPVEPLVVESGTDVDFDAMIGTLADMGYHRTDRVEARGEVAVRGGIIDVFPAQGEHAVRLDFWGDTVEEIRSFSVGSQRSLDAAERLVAYPARELVVTEDVAAAAEQLKSEESWASATWDRLAEGLHFQGMESWLPWVAPERSLLDVVDATVLVFDPPRVADRSGDLMKEEADLAAALADTWGKGAPEAGAHPALYLPIQTENPGAAILEAPPTRGGPGDLGYEVGGFDAVAGDAESVARAINRLAERDIQTIVAMDGRSAATRVGGLISEAGAGLPVLDSLDEIRSSVLPAGIHQGFVFPAAGVAVVGEQEIAGRRRSHRRAGARQGPEAEAYRDLQPGDYVVHHHHGIGRFHGLVHRDLAGAARDYLQIEYHGGDKLYVPTDQLAAVTRYTGGESPRLSRMGGSEWAQTRSKIRKAVAVVAEEVVDLHKKRAAAAGHAFDADTPWQREFEAAFPYEETADQLIAIRDVKTDMEELRPMDRLVFGDVGYGKTEVALRAMFKAVQDGKQAVMLVPTTLLAQQHFATMEDRFAPFPVRVEMLSRFLTAAQQKAVVRGLGDGSVDIVVGTHRLLSEDVQFKDLGLLVVDEEQRFGVAAKDRLKALRMSVDVLTITATPIPRTLEMALTGIREVTHIRTAPEDRHPILTYVGSYDSLAVAAAIRREMLREGQIFYVHNRVQSIDHAVLRLQELVPGARYAVAHGQMSEGQLEQVMYDFWNREYDVLVATTIIESGLDLPQVNTLIVERADRLGLGQLYQLRGRVGRSNQRAYAYLFHPPEERLAEDAYRRLEAIGEFSDLGSGFQLAMRDLEIRGAGSILSQTQSGHIAAVGFDLYAKLVADAVLELQGEKAEASEALDVRIDLLVRAHLPEDYVPDVDSRLEAYRRLAATTTEAAVDDVATEWADRYGEPPVEAEALIDVARLRVEALRIGIGEMVQTRREVRISPVVLKESQEVRLGRLARGSIVRGDVLYLAKPGASAGDLLTFLREMWPEG
jgi:transcription-repair coupling factor (superfamily II helicase)